MYEQVNTKQKGVLTSGEFKRLWWLVQILNQMLF